MAGHVLKLRGCTPEPLGNYLKGLGVFRLIAEQVDPEARAWWEDGFLHVLQNKWTPSDSATAESQCADWLQRECRFTALIAAWQKNTGYLPTGKRDKGGEALSALLQAAHPGTEEFREVFRDFAAAVNITLPDQRSGWVTAMGDAHTDASKGELLRLLRNRLRPGTTPQWLDAVGISLSRSRVSDDVQWFRILGTSGGGESSGGYIVNYQQRLKSVLLEDQEKSRLRLESSLFASNHAEALEGKALGAMYYPSLMKVPNAGQDFLPDPERRVNPWDFILLLEGCLVWSMAATRRKGVTSERVSFPFYCRSSFGGSTTIGLNEVEGSENSIAEGELWCPTWSAPSTLSEIQRIFGEGRIQIGERVCTRSLDFALAMTGLGVDRGIQAFHRYSLLARSGSGQQTTLLAVPNGCFVPQHAARLALLADLRNFAESVASNLNVNSQQPRRLVLARIEFEKAWFDATASVVASNRDASESLRDLLTAASRLNRELGSNSAKPGVVKIKKGENTSEKIINPVGDIRGGWAKLIDKTDHSSESRLARAIGGITAWGEALSDGGSASAVESIRVNLLPVARRGGRWRWDDTSRSAVWSRGAPLEANLAAVLRRRLIDAQRGVGDGLPLWSAYGAGFEDLLGYWNRELNDQPLVDLIHGAALVDTGSWHQDRIDRSQRERLQWSQTPHIDTSGIWFDDNDLPRGTFRLPSWLYPKEFDRACELPRVYHLLKLCFVGGRLPPRPVEGRTAARTGDEPFPPSCLDVLTLLQAGRLADAASLAAMRLRAMGYPTVLRDGDLQDLHMELDQCRRLAGMLLIPVRQVGVCAALAIKPATNT